jgi:hypothetical protein
MTHRWKFVRAGGFDQVQITTGADLAALPTLDQKLWVALACPIKGLELDERTLALMDDDGDGRIRAPELIAAVKWATTVLKDPDDLVKGASALSLSSIDDETPEGKILLRTAKTILGTLDKADAKKISVADMEHALESFAKQPFNGDGVVTEDSTGDPVLKKAIQDVLACTTTKEKDKNGKEGVNAVSIAAFFENVHAHAEWLAKGAEHRPLGDDTEGAFAALTAVRAKVDDYFARVKVAAYDPRAAALLNGDEKQYLELAASALSVSAAALDKLPLAQLAAAPALPLGGSVNPAWAERLRALQTKVVKPLIGDRDRLAEAEWSAIGAKFADRTKWADAKVGVAVEKLGAARVIELAGSDLRKKLDALVEADLAEAPQAKAIQSVEKIVRLNRDLMTLVNNFVAFRDFYSRKGPASFQAGTLYLDTRGCELTVRVDDAAKHAAMAPLSNAYLVYCDLKNAKSETMQIAAAVTAGDVDNLMVGRNGLFYDRKGKDWDATITKIIDNPISVRQAFWSPYKKALRMIEEQIAARAAREAAASDAHLATHVAAAPTATLAPPPRRFDVGTIAALGVAVGGITAALGAIFGAILGLGMWMPVGLVAVVLCISGPSMAVAWLKLRRRNLGPILDANGWAVNAQAIVNVPLGGSLTKEAELPAGSSRDLSDPFAEKPRPWAFYAIVLALLVGAAAWYLGELDDVLPIEARSVTVLGEHAPAAHPVTHEEPAAPAPDASP